MSKPKLDAARMQSELAESAFFRPPHPDQQTNKEENTQTSKSANQKTSKSVNQQTSKPASQKDDLLASEQISKSANQQASKSENQQTSTTDKTLLHKYGTYLRLDSIKAIKRVAVESDRKDYEVIQEAVDAYLRQQGRG